MAVRTPSARTAVLGYALGAAVVLVLLFVREQGAYINYAEGAYLVTARLILEGAVPYRDVAAAHPPLLFYTGAGLLAVSDSIDGVRVLLSCVSFATGALVCAATFRLTASGLAAALAGVLALLAPWSLHEHAILTPETFGAPLLLGAALLGSRPRTAAAAGVVAAVAIGFKWPFILPGLLLAVVVPARVRYLSAFLATFAVGVGLSLALFGGALYDQLVVAQQQVGWHTLRQDAGLVAQAAWNLVPLLVPAAAGVILGRHARDPVLLRVVAVLAAGTLVLVGTIAKTAVYINTIALAEPPLVALAVAGSCWLIRSVPAGRTRTVCGAAVAAAALLGAVEVASFVARPTDPGLFVRPFSAPAHAWTAAAEVDRRVRVARACPAGRAYSGVPFIAFLARRRMPGDQPDQGLLGFSTVVASARAAAARDSARCP